MRSIDLTLNGLVINVMPLSENDKLLTVLTDKKGKMSVLAKHLNSPDSKIAAGSNLFCYSEFSFTAKNSGFWPVEINVKNTFQNISQSMEGLALASYFLEVASHVCMQDNDESLMLKLLLNSLYAIDNAIKPCWMIKAGFEMQAMRCLGFMPNHDNCCYCGSSLPEIPSGNVVFETVQGGFACEKCAASETFNLTSDSFKLEPEAYRAIKYVSYTNSKQMLHYYLPDKYIVPFARACEHYVVVQTERKFKTADIFNSQFFMK